MGGIFLLIKIYPIFLNKLNANKLNVIGDNVTLCSRLSLFFQYFYTIFSNIKAENMINSVQTSVAPRILFFCFIIMEIIFYIIVLKFKFKKSKIISSEKLTAINILNGYFICYYIFTLLLIVRMQPQHFVQLIFHAIIILFCEAEAVTEYKKSTFILICFVSTLIIILNIRDNVIFQSMLKTQQGVSSYSIVNNQLAENAMENKKKEINEVWCFAEPGFIPNFIYLTNNSVKAPILYNVNGELDDNKVEDLTKYINDGYQINIITRNKEKIKPILQLVNKENAYNFEISDFYDSNNKFLFCNIKLKNES